MSIMPGKKYPAEQRERALRMAMDRLEQYPTPYACAKAWGRSWVSGSRPCGSGSCRLRSTGVTDPGRRPRSWRRSSGSRPRSGTCVRPTRSSRPPRFFRRGTRPSRPLIFGFIDEQHAAGRGVESICQVLGEQGLQVAPRSYRAWRTRPASARVLSDAEICDRLLALHTAGPAGRPAPEILYGRRKMTAWLNRAMAAEGRPPVSKHTVHRLMRQLGMNGLVRGRKTRTTMPGRRAPEEPLRPQAAWRGAAGRRRTGR